MYRVYLPLLVRAYGGEAASSKLSQTMPADVEAEGDWGSGDISPGETYAHTFTAGGDYPYYWEHSGFSGQVVVEPAVSDFALRLSPSTQAATAGELVTYTVRVTTTLGDSLPVALTISGLPAGASAELDPTTVVPTSTAVLTVTSILDTPAGDYTLVVTGTDGSQVRTATATLSILPHPDFGLGVEPTAAQVAQGEAVSYTVQVTAVHGFEEPVVLDVGGLPPAATAEWAASPLLPTASTVLTVSAAVDTPPGNYTLLITGTGDGLIRTASASVMVSGIPPDLMIEAMQVTPEIPIEGQQAQVSITVRNLGLSAAGAFQADWYLDPATDPGPGDAGTLSWQVDSLGPGKAAILTESFTFPEVGEFPAWAQADTLDQVAESNEDNNIMGPEMLTVSGEPEEVCGQITADTTWHSGMIYAVTCDVAVNAGVKLIVEPGAVVRFDSGTGLNVYGTVVGQGTGTQFISFVANSPSPLPGYWDGIDVFAGGRAAIEHAIVSHAGSTSGSTTRITTAATSTGAAEAVASATARRGTVSFRRPGGWGPMASGTRPGRGAGGAGGSAPPRPSSLIQYARASVGVASAMSHRTPGPGV